MLQKPQNILISKLSQQVFYVDKTRAYIGGASPDKIMKCRGKTVVEIKCPHKIWNKTIRGNFKDLDFLTLNTDGNISLNKKHRYYTQINSQIVLTKSDQGYFVVWRTKDIFLEKIDRDLIHWSKISINLVVTALLGKLCCDSFTWYSATYILWQMQQGLGGRERNY